MSAASARPFSTAPHGGRESEPSGGTPASGDRP